MTNFSSYVPDMVSNWDFIPDPIARWRKRQLLEMFLKNARRRPRFIELRPVKQSDYWAAYFLYAPDGAISPTHKYTLARFKDIGLKVLIVCATKSHRSIPQDVYEFGDAIYWKELSGFDFSAYAIALKVISNSSPHANVFVMNDSVYGPFSDIRPTLMHAPWELMGFTASSQVENHIQSYAFVIKDVCPARLRKLWTVFFPCTAINTWWEVTQLQESRLARVASKHMSVGSLWYATREKKINPMLTMPFELLDAGLPFLKRSLLGKHAHFQAPESVKDRLRLVGHPVDIP